MTVMKTLLAGGAGLAAVATAVPATAQYYWPYGAITPQTATQRCTAAVQNRLYSRNGLTGVIGSLFGAYATTPRVLRITEVNPNRSYIRVRGLASSGNYAYSPYGVGYYGALAYGYQPDLRFRCDIDYRGYVRDVDVDRR